MLILEVPAEVYELLESKLILAMRSATVKPPLTIEQKDAIWGEFFDGIDERSAQLAS